MRTSTETINVLIAEDEPGMRTMIEVQLALAEGIEVVGSVENGLEAVRWCRDAAPDVVVMDLLMPQMNGLEAIEILQAEVPQIAIVAYTAVAGQIVRDLSNSGRVEVLLKTGSIDPLVDAIRRVHAGARAAEGPAAE